MSYRIGAFLIDPAAHEIRREDAFVPVEPQVFDLLVLLIENRQRTVGKDEIIEHIWKGRIVSDANLSTRIKAARQVLGDDGSAQRLIRTVHGRGFRFVGEVVEAAPPASVSKTQQETGLMQGDQARAPAAASNAPAGAHIGTGLAAMLAGWRQRAMAAAGFAILLSASFLVNHLLTRPAGSGGHTAVKHSEPSRPVPAAQKAAQTFKDCDICPEMVALPEGYFLMGSPPNEAGRFLTEGPQRVVRFAKPFAIGKFEVTIDQFGSFADATGYKPSTQCLVYVFDVDTAVLKPHTFRDPSFAASGAHPAACVSWNDAKAYVAWLAHKTGKPYRLPSEAEWEYAARAGTTTPFSFGALDPTTVCEHAKTSDASARFPWRHTGCDSGWGHGAAPVGKHRPNAWGLHDMHGNLWEWVEDCRHSNFIDAPSDGSAWITGGDCSRRVARGGSWTNPPHSVRVAARHFAESASSAGSRGFRVALSLHP